MLIILGEVGFLAEDRRINVAVTRARRHIAVVCDTQTVQNHVFLKSLIDHMTEFGEVRTAFEYLQDIVPQNYARDHKDTKANASASRSTSTKQSVKDGAPSKVKQGQKKPTGSSNKENTAGAGKETKSRAPAATDEGQNKSRYTEIRQQVENFLKDLHQREMHFPSSFNSHDRLLVHQIAEELGLVHESKGEGKDRCITVSRPLESKPAKELTQAQKEEKAEEEEAQEEETTPNPQSEPQSQPPLDLKSLHLERMKREQQKREENAQQKKQQNNFPPAQTQSSKKAKGLFISSTENVSYVKHLPRVSDTVISFPAKNRTKAGACDIAAAAAPDDDFDELINAVKKANSVCSFVKCKASVLTLGQLCLFCNRQYCLSHHIPEVRHEYTAAEWCSFGLFVFLVVLYYNILKAYAVP